MWGCNGNTQSPNCERGCWDTGLRVDDNEYESIISAGGDLKYSTINRGALPHYNPHHYQGQILVVVFYPVVELLLLFGAGEPHFV